VTTSSAERGRRLRERGATLVLDRSGAAQQGSGSEAPAGAFDVIVDVVGGEDVPLFIERLAANGRYVLVGAIAGFPGPDFAQPLLTGFQLSRSFAAFSLATVAVADRNRVRQEVLEAAVRGDLSPVVHEVLPLAQAARAHRLMDDGSVFGRVVLVP
jgi:NADPH2:quinone reductase